jgi:hypothetical protein
MTTTGKCCCGEVDLQGDKWKVVGGVCHKSYAPCHLAPKNTKKECECCDEIHPGQSHIPNTHAHLIGCKTTIAPKDEGESVLPTNPDQNSSRLVVESEWEERCTRCNSPFLEHHWKFSHRDEHYHSGCLEKTPIKLTQMIEGARKSDKEKMVELVRGMMKEAWSELDEGNGWNAALSTLIDHLSKDI